MQISSIILQTAPQVFIVLEYCFFFSGGRDHGTTDHHANIIGCIGADGFYNLIMTIIRFLSVVDISGGAIIGFHSAIRAFRIHPCMLPQ